MNHSIFFYSKTPANHSTSQENNFTFTIKHENNHLGENMFKKYTWLKNNTCKIKNINYSVLIFLKINKDNIIKKFKKFS